MTGIRIDAVEYLVDGAPQSSSQTLIASDRTHHTPSTFVPGDPRRNDGANLITYLVDQSDNLAVSRSSPTGAPFLLQNPQLEPALRSSTIWWAESTSCGAPQLVQVVDDGTDPDRVDALVLRNAALDGTHRADITHAGFLPPAFFNAIAPGGANFILGVTFSYIFVDDEGNETDINRDGRDDAAVREIYYNQGFYWGFGTPGSIDLASVITHEAGHAFGLGHFGRVFVTKKDAEDGGISLAEIIYAPRAIMNASYTSPFAQMTGTDAASFCGLWARAQ